MTTVSIIIPVYNVEQYVAETIKSVLVQTYQDFEIIIVDDESPDRSIEICQNFTDPRIRIIQQKNRGLAGARNTGIRQSQGNYLALLDSDDLWLPEKLECQLQHLQTHPDVGVSFCRAAFIDEQGSPLGVYQMPRLTDIDAAYLFQSNAIGSGSTPMVRRQVFEAIKFQDQLRGELEDCYFDERLMRSEDLDCWIRIVLQTPWKIEGTSEPLALYRVNSSSLSSNLLKQFESWEQVLEKTRTYAPEVASQVEQLARAHQLRYLSRQAIRLKDGEMAMTLINHSLMSDWHICVQEPRRTLLTIVAAYLIRILPPLLYDQMEQIALKVVGGLEEQSIRRELQQKQL